jgi:excisionase family DNA binding protein
MTRPLSVKQVAEQLGVGSRSILRYVDEGKFPPGFLLGGRRKWVQEQIDEFIRKQIAKAGKS